MNGKAILEAIGTFSNEDAILFENHITIKTLLKNETLLQEGNTCQSVYYVLSGSFFQFREKDIDEVIIDLHTQDEWVFNNQSLFEQTVSSTSIKAFENSEVLELSLVNLHRLIACSPAFLQFTAVLNSSNTRSHIYDHALNPAARYAYINKVKPALSRVFPVKFIASYLKMAPETLSRVRALG